MSGVGHAKGRRTATQVEKEKNNNKKEKKEKNLELVMPRGGRQPLENAVDQVKRKKNNDKRKKKKIEKTWSGLCQGEADSHSRTLSTK